MKKALLFALLAFLSAAGGLGAAIATAPAPDSAGGAHASDDAHEDAHAHEADTPESAAHDDHDQGHDGHGDAASYIKLPNQFIVPVVRDGVVSAMAVLSLGVETPESHQPEVLSMRPKLTDAFLTALFEHSNAGGFDGDFTSQNARSLLKSHLLTAAHETAGEYVTDILLLELNLQSF